jgi:hypothetical protein
MKLRQWMTMNWLLHMLDPELVRHGDCQGSDAEVSWLLHSYLPQCEQYAHPSDLQQYQARTTAHHTFPAAPPLTRNRLMVDLTDITIATPFEDEPVLRSGTWSTIRYSMSLHKPTIIIKRDGSISVFDGRKVLPMQTATVDLTPTALTADTAGTTGVLLNSTPNGWVGAYAQGTWGSGTLKLQQSVDGTTWIDVTSASWTANAYKHLQFFAKYVRIVLTGSTAPSLKVYLASQVPTTLPTRTDS